MHNRFAALAALTAIAGLAGCTSAPTPTTQPAGALPPLTAQVTINGDDVGMTNTVSCFQDGRTWTIDAGDDAAGITAVLSTSDGVAAKSILIRNLDGFTGSYWDGTNGNATAELVEGNWMVSGAVDGFNTSDPGVQRDSRDFTIKVNC